MGVSITIGHDGDPGLLGVGPVLEGLSDTTLVLNANILSDGVSL